MLTILIVILIVCLLSGGIAYRGGVNLGLILLILLILILLGGVGYRSIS